jgi:hypothetical protein
MLIGQTTKIQLDVINIDITSCRTAYAQYARERSPTRMHRFQVFNLNDRLNTY